MKLVTANAGLPSERLALAATPLFPKLTEVSLAASGVEGSLSSLIARIVECHHAYTRTELARLGALAATVSTLDATLSGVKAVLDLFAALDPELRAHMTKEEAVVFPYIVSLEKHLLLGRSLVRSPFGVLERPLGVMLDEQGETRVLLASIRSASKGYAPPPGASKALADYYQGLEDLERDLSHHGRLETEILFPRALELEQRVNG